MDEAIEKNIRKKYRQNIEKNMYQKKYQERQHLLFFQYFFFHILDGRSLCHLMNIFLRSFE